MPICFAADWRKYPNAIVATKPTNPAWLELAQIYKTMGIKNCDFFLALYNPSLDGVNPYDPKLDVETKIAIAVEARYNPWYTLREIIRVPQKGNPVPVHVRPNRSIVALHWCFFVHQDAFIIQPRQTGKSLGSEALETSLQCVIGRSTYITHLTRSDDLRVETIAKLKAMRDALPDYINPHNPKTDPDNQSMLEVKAYSNKLLTAVPRSSEDQAYGVGRGHTSQITVNDETPFIPFVDIILKSMSSMTNNARETARLNGSYYGNVFTTTAGRRTTAEGAYIYKLVSRGLVYDERILFDARNEAHVDKIVRRACGDSRPLINATFSHRQLGYTDKYHYDNLKRAGDTGEIADMDYFNIWSNGGRASPIPAKIVASIVGSIREPLHAEISARDYVVRWYVTEDELSNHCVGRRIVMSTDPSEGSGSDYLATVVMDADTAEVLAVWSVNEININEYAKFVADMLIHKLPQAVWIPERKSSGQAIIDIVCEMLISVGVDPFRRIYNTLVEDEAYKRDEHREMRLHPQARRLNYMDRVKSTFGYATSGMGRHSRGKLYSGLVKAATIGHNVMYDATLVNELIGIEERNGRLDHGKNAHDDLVIAYLLAHWFLSSTTNLAYYGLEDPYRAAKPFKDKQKEKEETSQDRLENKLESRLKTEILELVKRLEDCGDDTMFETLERRIAQKASLLPASEHTSLSLDTLLKEIREKKRRHY